MSATGLYRVPFRGETANVRHINSVNTTCEGVPETVMPVTREETD